MIFAILRKHYPGVRVPGDMEDGGLNKQKIDTELAKELLGGWISLERSIMETAQRLGYVQRK